MTRQIFRLTGGDRTHFLQGLVSNDVTRDGLTYAALLTPQGKYLADFFLLAQDDAILIDVDATLAPGLKQRLTMYKLRADVQIESSDIPVARGTGPMPDGAFVDPRDAAMGWRGYGVGTDDATDWDALRVAHLIPETGVELTPDTYILEAGFERLEWCRLPQRLLRRAGSHRPDETQNAAEKGVARVTVNGTTPVGTAITAGGKPVGTLFTQSGGQAIAYLRFDRAGPDMQAGDARVAWSG